MLWGGDTRVRILQNVQAYDGPVCLGTITAPGRDQLPDARATHTWNDAAPERWTQLHRAARQAALRACEHPPTLLAWTWEYQRRGALHKHFILGMRTARERAAAHAYMLALDRLRHEHGYGFVSDTRRSGKWRRVGPQIITRERASRYVAKYLVKAVGDTIALTETVLHRDVPPLVVYVSRRLTMSTGVTMRSLRLRRRAWALGCDASTGELHRDVADQELVELALVLDRLRGPPTSSRGVPSPARCR